MKFGAWDENCLTDFPSLLFLNNARVGKSLISAVSQISCRSSQSTVKITTSTNKVNNYIINTLSINIIRIKMSKLTINNLINFCLLKLYLWDCWFRYELDRKSPLDLGSAGTILFQNLQMLLTHSLCNI